MPQKKTMCQVSDLLAKGFRSSIYGLGGARRPFTAQKAQRPPPRATPKTKVVTITALLNAFS